MNLVYSCVFVQKEYIELFDKLLETFNKHEENHTITYLVITSPNFESDIKTLFENVDVKYDIFSD